MDEMTRPYHSVASLFPLMDGAEYEELKTDIKANGLREAIWLHPDGSIIDGRNRHRACLDVGVTPRFRTWQDDGALAAFVVSLNLYRRHLTASQRATIGVELLPMLEADARERQRGGQGGVLLREIIPQANGGKATDQAGTIVGVSGRYVSDAKAIKDEDPELFEQIRAGDLNIAQAKRELNHRNKTEPPPMSGKYRVLYADPPWAYDNSGFEQSAQQFYPTMAVDDIAALPVASIADEPAVLYLWATSPLLPEALRVMAAWGFEYKAHRIWRKDRAPGIGWWLRTEHELLLIGTRGGNYHPSEKLPSVVEAAVSIHSRKPDSFRADIERVHGGPYIELFGRRATIGWDLWGNEDVQQ